MGNSNGKDSLSVNDSEKNQERRQLSKGSSELRVDKNVVSVDSEKKDARRARPNPGLPRNVPKAREGEQVAAGWPVWLSSVAGEAIQGWTPRRADSFEKIDKIGDGSYSIVYKARDVICNKIVALKKVWIDNLDPESVKFAAREIIILRRLDHPNVIKLEGLICSRMTSNLYLVFEYMEHDLTGLLSMPDIKFTEPQIKCYMRQLLCGLEHCHNRDVLHRDIKSSNLLVNNDGVLKIADFGLSSFFDPQRKVPLTSRVVTLWYRPPELLLGSMYYKAEVDLWSTGCVLGELYAGKPIMPGRTEVEQLHKIYKLCGSPSEDYWRKSELPGKTIFQPRQPYRRCLGETFKDHPAVTVRLLETLLSFDPERRGTASLALKSEFFTTKPFACDPSSLPKYTPNTAIRMKAISLGAPIRAMRINANADLAGSQEHHGHGRSDKAPFPVASDNVAQMQNEHERQIQGATRRAWPWKIKAEKVQSQPMQPRANPVESNPLLGPSIDVDKMLEEHDRHIQEAARQVRVEKQKVGRVQVPEVRPTAVYKASFEPGPSLVQSCNVDQLLEEHDRHIQESFRQSMLKKKRVGMSRPDDANS